MPVVVGGKKGYFYMSATLSKLERLRQKKTTKKPPITSTSYFRSCRRSLALSIVMREVVAAGMMMMGVRDPGDKVLKTSRLANASR